MKKTSRAEAFSTLQKGRYGLRHSTRAVCCHFRNTLWINALHNTFRPACCFCNPKRHSTTRSRANGTTLAMLYTGEGYLPCRSGPRSRINKW